MGIRTCTLIVHSISGVYGLYLAEQYPEKVLGFIGVDISVSKQADLFDYDQFVPELDSYHAIGALPAERITREKHPEFHVYCTDYEYSKEDQALFLQLSRNMYNGTIQDEWKHLHRNFALLRGHTFPDDLPVLLFVAESGREDLDNWVEIHQEMLVSDLHRMITFDGPHALYREHLNDMMPDIEAFLANIFTP